MADKNIQKPFKKKYVSHWDSELSSNYQTGIWEGYNFGIKIFLYQGRNFCHIFKKKGTLRVTNLFIY